MRLKYVLLAATASGFGICAPAVAQEAGGGATKPVAGLDDSEIIVTARRRDEQAQDVPLVVNAVTGETIAKLNIRNFQEVTSVVPGLSLTPAASGIGSSSSLRGVTHDVNASYENGTIQYYLNDAPVYSNQALQALYDVNQIEVLRGPQGTLRGRATPSGSITIGTTPVNLTEAGGYVAGTLGTKDASNVNFALNVPVLEDKLGLRVAGLRDVTRGDRVRSVNSPIDPRRETRSVRATLQANPVDVLKLRLIYQTLRTNSVSFDQVQSFGLLNPAFTPSAIAPDFGTITLDDRRSVEFAPRRSSQKLSTLNWNAELSLSDQRLIYVGGRQKAVFRALTPTDINGFFPSLSPYQTSNTDEIVYSHEVRLQNDSRIFGMLDYVVGYFRQSGSGSNSVIQNQSIARFFAQIAPGVSFPLPVPPSLINTAIYKPRSAQAEESFFANLTAHLGENTEIAGGLRRISYDLEGGGLFIGCDPSASAACPPQRGTDVPTSAKATIHNVTAKHRFNDNIMVYASTGSSWRPPVQAIGDFTSAPYTANELAHLYLPPERSKSYEIGLKSNWLNRTLTLNATYFHQDFKNYPFRAGTGIQFINVNSSGAQEVGQFNFVSAVPVKVDGVEAELAYNPSPRFSFATTLNWAKSKIGNASIACTDALNNSSGAAGSDGIADVVVPTLAQLRAAYGAERLAVCPGGGQSASFLPEWSGSARAEYNQPLASGIEGYVRGLLSWRGKSQTDPNNRFDNVGAYGLANVYLGVRAADGAWELTLYGKNVTDQTKITTRSDFAYPTSVIDIGLAPPRFTTPAGVTSTNLVGRYSGVTVTPPREFGAILRVAFGSR